MYVEPDLSAYCNKAIQITSVLSISATGDTHSDSCSIKCCIPQCSMLSPLLFLIYFIDMRAAINCKLLLYVDDSALMTSVKMYRR